MIEDIDHGEHCHDGMGACLSQMHVEGWTVSSDGFGRNVRCANCRDVFFVDDPIDAPDDERDHQFGHGG